MSITSRARANTIAALLGAAFAACGVYAGAEAQIPETTYQLNIPSQDLNDALQALALASRHRLFYQADIVSGKVNTALNGTYTTEEAIRTMLAGTDLRYEISADGVVFVRPKDGVPQAKTIKAERIRMAQADSSDTTDPAAPLEELDTSGIPEVFVTGSRLLNMDVVRTRDDPQPYQILDSQMIERSGAASVEDFLKLNVTANTQALSNGQLNAAAIGNSSSINLRGLGTASTLILVNGRRAVGGSYFGSNIQPDLNNLPLTAIERIEVLPSAASAIYGGAAMGGVVNVITKHNYQGGEARVRYENTFESHAPIYDIDLSFGQSFEEGRTHVLVAAHHSETEYLVNEDRPELLQAGIERVLQRSPTLLTSSTNPFHGATPNISSTDGSNLVLDGGTSLGSSMAHILPGTANPDVAAIIPGYDMTLPNTADGIVGLKRPFGSAPRLTSVMAVARRQMTDGFELFSEFSHSRNSTRSVFNPLSTYVVPASASINPFAQDVRINIPDATQDNAYQAEYMSQRAVLGFIGDLPGGWKMEGDYTWNSIDYELDAQFMRLSNALATGLINPFIDTMAFPLALEPFLTGGDGRPSFASTSYLHDVGLRFVGRVGHLPAGRPILTLGLGYRKEGMKEASLISVAPGAVAESFEYRYLPQSQDIYSLYGEGQIPIVSDANRFTGVKGLDLQLAIRSERYTVKSNMARAPVGSPLLDTDPSTTRYTSTNGTVGLRYEMVDGVSLRASFSTGFLPPTYSQLLPGVLTATVPVAIIDPRRGNSLTYTYVIQGGNPELDPQELETFNLGLVLEPTFAPGLRVNADWFRSVQDNAILSLSFQQIVDRESEFPSRITRGPVQPGDPYGVGEITLLDQTLINGARLQIEGVDFGIDYTRRTERRGAFGIRTAATLFREYSVQTTIDTPLVDTVNQVANGGPLKFKANAALDWRLRGWNAGWSTYYFGSYDQYNINTDLYVLAQGSNTVPSQIYHDLFVGYRFSDGDHLDALEDVHVQFGVKNVFDKAPPFDAAYSSPGYFSPFGDARMRSYTLSVSKVF